MLALLSSTSLACDTSARPETAPLRQTNSSLFRLIDARFCGGCGRLVQVSAQEASDCRSKLARDILELGNIVSVKTGHVSKTVKGIMSRPPAEQRMSPRS